MSENSVSSAPRRRRIQEDLVPSRKSKGQENGKDPDRIRGKGRQKQEPQQPSIQPAPSPAPSTPSTQPSEARTLAERYVAQYETNSGHTLTTDERQEKIGQIEEFYGEAGREGRLAKIVFA